jgi:hypothetical protein
VNAWQVAQQIRYLLSAATWEDSPGDEVFGRSVAVIPEALPEDAEFGRFGIPFAVVAPGAFEADRSIADALRYSFDVVIVAQVDSDDIGEATVVGGPRSSSGSSEGRGLLELLEPTLIAIGQLDPTNQGVSVFGVRGSGAAVVGDRDAGFFGLLRITLSVEVTVRRFYEPVHAFRGTDQTGGEILLEWTLPALRYDTYRVLIERAAGGVPPASPGDGTELTLASNLPSSHTDDPGAGTFSYSAWLVYDELDARPEGIPDSDDRFSAKQTITSAVVT